MQDRDNLEKFVAENREAFDDRLPNRDIWSAIDQDLRAQVQPPTRTAWYWKVAVILLLGAVSFLLFDKYSVQTETLTDLESAEESNVEKFEDLESFYASIINRKRIKLDEELVSNSEHYNYIEADLQELNELYADLKEMFLESQPSDELLDRLLHLLRQKIHLINSQLDIIGTEKIKASSREVDLTT